MISLPTFVNILSSFASQGLVFSNEQDFQFAFALALDQLPSVSHVKLEALSIDEDWTEIEKKIQSGKPVSAKNALVRLSFALLHRLQGQRKISQPGLFIPDY